MLDFISNKFGCCKGAILLGAAFKHEAKPIHKNWLCYFFNLNNYFRGIGEASYVISLLLVWNCFLLVQVLQNDVVAVGPFFEPVNCDLFALFLLSSRSPFRNHLCPFLLVGEYKKVLSHLSLRLTHIVLH